MKYNTGNPLGSADPRDLYDTASVADNLVHGEEPAYTDRLGKSRKSWAGMEKGFDEFLANSGFEILGDYAGGIEITAYNQVIRYNSALYSVKASTELPYTTNGAWATDEPFLLNRDDGVLRQDLSSKDNGRGASLVSMKDGPSVEEAVKNRVIRVGSVAEIESYSVPFGYVFSLNDSGRSGVFDVVEGDYTTQVAADTLKGVYVALADDPAGAAKVAKRRFDGAASHFWFDAESGGGSTADAIAIQKALDVVGNVSLEKCDGIAISEQVVMPMGSALQACGRLSKVTSSVNGYWLRVSGYNTVRDLEADDTGLENASACYFPPGSPAVHFENVKFDATDAAIGFAADGGSDFVSQGGQYYTAKAPGTAAAVRVLGEDSAAVPRKFYGPSSRGCTLFDFGGCNNFFISGGYTNGLIFSSSAASKVMATNLRVGSAAGVVTISGTQHQIDNCIFAAAVVLDSGAINCSLGNCEVPDYNITDNGSGNRFTVEKAIVPELNAGGVPVTIGTGTLRGVVSRVNRRVSLDYFLRFGADSDSGAGEWRFSIPYKVDTNYRYVGEVVMYDASAANYRHGKCFIVPAVSEIRVVFDNSSSLLSENNPFTWAEGDELQLSISYFTK